METVTISAKYRVVIPRRVRESLGLKPGDKLHVLDSDGRIELVPLRTLSEMCGFLPGLDTKVERDGDR